MTRAGIRRAHGFAGSFAAGGHEPEVHLLLEAIDLGDLDGDGVAEADDAAGATSDEVIAGGFEDVEVVLEARQRDEPGHGEIGNVDEEAEVADVGDQRRVRDGSGLELGLQEGEQLDVLAVAFGVGGIAFGQGDVIGDALKVGEGLGAGLERGAVDEQVGIATDGGGEVGVLPFGEAVVAEGLDGVACPHEGLEEADAQGRPDGDAGEPLEETLDFGALSEVSAGHVVAQHFLAIFEESAGVGFLVDAVDGRDLAAHEMGGDGLIGEEHVFLDQLVRHVVLDPVDAGHATVVVEPDLHLREIEFEGTILEPAAPDALGELMSLVQHDLNGRGGIALEHGQGLRVREPFPGTDHRGMELRVEHLPLRGEQKLDAFGQPFHVGLERAQLVAQRFGQHRDDPVDQVGRVAALACLHVEGGAGLDVVGHVGDVNPEAPALGADPFQADRVVEILRVVGVDGDDVVRTAVHPPGEVVRVDDRSMVSCLPERLGREMQGEVVLAQDGEQVDPFGVGGTEELDDFPLGIGMARLPLAEFDDDLVAGARNTSEIARRGDVDVVGDPGVIRHDVEELGTGLESADEAGATSFEDADHGAGGGCRWRGARLATESLRQDVASDEHPILVERGAGGAFGDGDLGEAGVVRLEKALALAVHPDAPGDQVGVAGGDVAFPLGPGDVAGLFQVLEGRAEVRFLFPR